MVLDFFFPPDPLPDELPDPATLPDPDPDAELPDPDEPDDPEEAPDDPAEDDAPDDDALLGTALKCTSFFLRSLRPASAACIVKIAAKIANITVFLCISIVYLKDIFIFN